MPIEYSRRENRLVSIDDRFLIKCKKIADEIYNIGTEDIRNENSLSKKQIDEVIRGKPITYNSPKYQELYAASRSLKDLEPSFSVRFDDGTTVASSEISQIEDALTSSSSRCMAFTAHFGRYNKIIFQLEIDADRIKNSTIRISGNLATVNHLKALFFDLIEGAKPEHAFFRKEIFWWWVGVVIYSVWFAICIAILQILIDRGQTGLGGFGLFMLMVMFPAPLLISATRRVRKAFPEIEFRFGSQMQQVFSSRSIVMYVFTTIMIPLAFIAIGILVERYLVPLT